MEVLEHLNCALSTKKYLTQRVFDELRTSWNSVRGLPGGFISYLEKLCPKNKKAKNESNRNPQRQGS